MRFAAGTTEFDDDVDKVETEDDGFDLRGEFDLTEQAFMRARYTSTSSSDFEFNGVDVDGIDLDTDIARFGFGVRGGESVKYFGSLEYVNAKVEISDDSGSVDGKDNGALLSFGLRDDGKGAFLWNVELGYAKLDDSDGGVFQFDLGWRVTPMIAIVVGGQGYSLEDDANIQYDIGQGSLGVRVQF